MIIDQPKYKTSDEVDFVVVGSGAAGGVLAKELSTKGFRHVKGSTRRCGDRRRRFHRSKRLRYGRRLDAAFAPPAGGRSRVGRCGRR